MFDALFFQLRRRIDHTKHSSSWWRWWRLHQDIYVVTISIIYSKIKILRKVLDHVLLHHQEDRQGGLRLHHPHRRLHLRLLHHPLQQRDRVLRWPLQIFPQGFYLWQRIHIKVKKDCFWVLIPMNSGVCDDSWRVWIWRTVDKLASRGRQVEALFNYYKFKLFVFTLWDGCSIWVDP